MVYSSFSSSPRTREYFSMDRGGSATDSGQGSRHSNFCTTRSNAVIIIDGGEWGEGDLKEHIPKDERRGKAGGGGEGEGEGGRIKGRGGNVRVSVGGG